MFDLVEIGNEVWLCGRARNEFGRKIGINSHHEECCAIQGVGTCRVDRYRLFAAFNDELHLCAGRLADPVALHQQHFFGPAGFELLHVIEQSLGIVGDAEVPLRQLLLRDCAIASLTKSANNLLIGEHGLTRRAPVDGRCLAIGKTALVHL